MGDVDKARIQTCMFVVTRMPRSRGNPEPNGREDHRCLNTSPALLT
jgi:hypothetical protein